MKPIRPLLLTTSIAALVMAAPALAQEVKPDEKTAPASIENQVPLIRIAPELDPQQQTPPAETESEAVEEAGEEEAGEDGEPADTELPPEPIIAIPVEWAPIPTDNQGKSAYGLYLAGRAALARNVTSEGAELLQRAYELTPEQPRLREQAFTAAILTGDLDFASNSVPNRVGASPVVTEAGKLISGIQSYLHRGARYANQVFEQSPVDMPHDRAATYAQVWIAAEARDWDRAFAPPPADFDMISALVARSNRARLLEIRRRHAEAETEWKELVSHAQAGVLFRLPYGEFLERRKRKEEALALYDASIAVNQAEPRMYLARERVVSGAKPPALPTYREGVAMSLRTAADQMIAQGAHEFAVVYMRLAQQLYPTSQNQVMIGQSLINANLAEAGRQALAQVPASDVSLYAGALVQRGMSFDKQGLNQEALAEFRKANELLPEDASVAYVLAGHLIKMDVFDEALELLNGPLLSGDAQGYEIRFLRGAAYEALGRVEDAEKELQAAYNAGANDPAVLNYLGYLWVDKDLKLEEGTALIRRALEAEPENGHYLDSLGWAYFKQGQLDEALAHIEKAVAKLPANAEINDHLGDVYWAMGRQREAGFQWQRVLTLDVDQDQRTKVEAKLNDRLNQRPYNEAATNAASEAAATPQP